MEELPTGLNDRYTVLQQIGAGSFGDVFLALENGSGEKVGDAMLLEPIFSIISLLIT